MTCLDLGSGKAHSICMTIQQFYDFTDSFYVFLIRIRLINTLHQGHKIFKILHGTDFHGFIAIGREICSGCKNDFTGQLQHIFQPVVCLYVKVIDNNQCVFIKN